MTKILEYKIYDYSRKLIKEKITLKALAERVGINRSYLSEIIKGRPTTKLTAYAICKGTSQFYEIEDLFEKIN